MSVDQLLNPACNYTIYCDQVIPKYGTGSEGDITLIGNVTGTGVSGLVPVNTSLAPTMNLPSTTANETFNFDPSQLNTQLILQNNAPLSASIERNHILLMNSAGYGFDLSQDSTVSNPNGSFQLVALPSEVSAFFFDPATSPPVFTFNTNVTMQEDLNMDNREIHNLNMAGSPAPTDAVNVAYVTGLVSNTTLATDSGSATAVSSTINVNAKNIAGSSVTFSGSGNTMQLHTTDSILNTIIGSGAGNNSISGSQNTALGYDTLNGLTSGAQNAALGYQCLFSNTSGPGNTALGYQCLYSNTTGPGNVGIGYQAGYTNTTSGNCTAIGNAAMYSNTAGNNTAVGYHAMYANTSGAANTAFGSQALASNMTGNDNTAIGYYSLPIDTGHDNVAIGNYSGSGYTGSESNNIVIGSNCNGTAGESNVTRIGTSQTYCNIAGINGQSITGIGTVVSVSSTGQLGSNTTSNVVLGFQSGSLITSGTSNTAIGYQTLAANISGTDNTGIGNHALEANTTSHITAVGSGALQSNSTGNNAAFGYEALQNVTTGSQNCAFGYLSLWQDTGSFNTAMGYQTLHFNTTGTTNSAFGNSTLATNTTGSNNTGIGDEVLVLNTTGSSNTACGQGSLQDNTTGGTNCAFGHFALGDLTSGSGNTCLGDSAGFNYTGSESNNIIIGASVGGTVGESNVTRIGPQSTQTSCYVAGISGATVTGSAVLVNLTTGQLGLAVSTRDKKDGIIDVDKESNHKLLHAMRPRNFWYKGLKQSVDTIEYGYIVDEVEAIGGGHLVAYKNTTDIDGEVIMDADGKLLKTPVTIKYQQIPTMLHTELKYQYEIIEKLTSRVVDLDDENALLTATVRDLNTTVQNLNTTIYVLLDRLHAVEKIIYPDTA